MFQITVYIEGMRCGMCEAHMNDALRKAFPVKKVTSSHKKGRTIILTESSISEQQLKEVIDKTGYTFISAEKEPYEKKGLFSFDRK